MPNARCRPLRGGPDRDNHLTFVDFHLERGGKPDLSPGAYTFSFEDLAAVDLDDDGVVLEPSSTPPSPSPLRDPPLVSRRS